MSGLPTTNHHYTQAFRYNMQPNLTAQTPLASQTGNMERHNHEYFQRYSTPYSSKTNIFDNSRTVMPQNVFGRQFIPYSDPYVNLNPAGMFNQTLTNPISYSMTTKPFVKKYNVV